MRAKPGYKRCKPENSRIRNWLNANEDADMSQVEAK